MKKIFIFAAIMAAVSLTGCQKEEKTTLADEGICELSVSFGSDVDIRTKVPGAVNDDNIIKDVQILVFRKESSDSDSKVDAATRISGLNVTGGQYTTTESLSCTYGSREVWVVVNAPADYTQGNDAVLTLAELKAKTTVLGDNKYGTAEKSFVMAGNKIVELASASETVSVDVARMACKVVVKAVENKFILPIYQASGSLKVTGAFLLSAAGYQKLDNLNTVSSARTFFPASAIPADYWHGKNAKEAGNNLVTDGYSPAKGLEYNSKLENISTFYAYPNDADPSSSETWSSRRTLLVIETTLKGETLYYPIELPVLWSNKCYEVSLTIKHPGSPYPWKPVNFDSISSKITVRTWDNVPVISEI